MSEAEKPRELNRVEYQTRPVTRYIITKYEEWSDSSSGVQQLGEYDNAELAWEVAYALCKQRHELIGWAPGDERIQYPRHPMQPPEQVI